MKTELENSPSNPLAPREAETAVSAPARSMSQKLLAVFLWGTAILVLGTIIAGKLIAKYFPGHEDLAVLYHTPGYTLTDQDGQAFSSDQLRYEAYICDFIFTTCGSVCPVMSQKMESLQKQTSEKVQLVSFTVNPEFDTPAVLKQYAAAHHADSARWHFLTGTPGQMTQVVRDMKLGFQPASGETPILHSEMFLLMDGDGNVRGHYDSTDPEAMKKLVSDANWLSHTPAARGR